MNQQNQYQNTFSQDLTQCNALHTLIRQTINYSVVQCSWHSQI